MPLSSLPLHIDEFLIENEMDNLREYEILIELHRENTRRLNFRLFILQSFLRNGHFHTLKRSTRYKICSFFAKTPLNQPKRRILFFQQGLVR